MAAICRWSALFAFLALTLLMRAPEVAFVGKVPVAYMMLWLPPPQTR